MKNIIYKGLFVIIQPSELINLYFEQQTHNDRNVDDLINETIEIGQSSPTQEIDTAAKKVNNRTHIE